MADEFLIIISPFIKLHSRYKDSLKSKINNHKFELTVVFGKNEENISKSINADDLEFLKQFPNVKIAYEPRLHAKYYSNEFSALLTSMNLYDYSQDHNIEFGILTKTGNFIADPLDKDAFNYFDVVIENSELLFQKVPRYEKTNLGLTSKYVESEIEVDILEQRLSNSKQTNRITKKQESFAPGFCIRTGVKILFNPKKPLSDKAYKNWLKFGNENFPEKYCHYSGEQSNGETTFIKPILKKNWSKASSLMK